MILVADAGSTKTSWAVVNHSEMDFFETPGINPVFLSETEISDILQKEFPTDILKHRFDHVAFYGAGCADARNALKVEEGLSAVLKSKRFEIEHDMMGAAIALCKNEPGIACILGTGSNSCFFDGKTISISIASPGYILADEGGGTQLGRKILLDYLRGDLPEDLKQLLEDKFRVSEHDILKRIYSEPGANRYLASFVQLLADQQEHPYTQEIVFREFSRFYEHHLRRYTTIAETPVHFTGSVAFIFKTVLERLSKEKGFTIGLVIQQPIRELSAYYAEHFHDYVASNPINDSY